VARTAAGEYGADVLALLALALKQPLNLHPANWRTTQREALVALSTDASTAASATATAYA
jgi:hypothetical protein